MDECERREGEAILRHFTFMESETQCPQTVGKEPA